MCAMPTANVGAPPARLNIVDSPRFIASFCISASVTGNPAAETLATTSVGEPLVLMSKYSPGCNTQAAIMAIRPTIISVPNARYPVGGFRGSRVLIFRVGTEGNHGRTHDPAR